MFVASLKHQLYGGHFVLVTAELMKSPEEMLLLNSWQKWLSYQVIIVTYCVHNLLIYSNLCCTRGIICPGKDQIYLGAPIFFNSYNILSIYYMNVLQ